jgi:hypothetical protein
MILAPVIALHGNTSWVPRRSDECVTRMRMETKFPRLRTPITIGSRFGEWSVCWLGGWTRPRLAYLVMVVRIVE